MSPPRGRPRDERATAAILQATLELLTARGFTDMSVDAVASASGVSKPAIYRRFATKAELVVAAINSVLAPMEVPGDASTEAGLRRLFLEGMPTDAPAYVALIGELAALERRHPELMQTFRERLLLPRRAVALRAIVDGQQRGDIRSDIAAERLLDLLAGPILARAFAGADTDMRWKRGQFADWWRLVAA